MHWDDEAIVLGGRLHGESGLILDVLTRMHGRRAGYVHGGASRARRALYEPGNTLELAWEARTEDALGWFGLSETLRARSAFVLEDASRLAAIASVTTLLREVLQEGEAHPGLYEATTVLLDQVAEGEIWPAVYVRWEVGLLGALGYGLDLGRCAVSGENDGLTHVSPRTGRAVKGSEAADYVDRLLPLPGFLAGRGGLPLPEEILQGLDLTGYFLERRVFHNVNRAMPEARTRLVERLKADAAAG